MEYPDCVIPDSLCVKLWKEYTVNLQRNSGQNLRNPFKIIVQGCGSPAQINNRTCNAAMGEEVVLLYWPPEIENRDICVDRNKPFAKWRTKTSTTTEAAKSYVTTAITFNGADLYLLNETAHYQNKKPVTLTWNTTRASPSTLYGNFTFYSPTIYIAHQPITAYIGRYNSERNIYDSFVTTQIASAGIIAVEMENILYAPLPFTAPTASQNLEYIRAMAMGRYYELPLSARIELGIPRGFNGYTTGLTQINIADLMNPVPASIYYGAREDCWGKQSHCGIIEDDSYRPRLALRDLPFFRLLPDHFDCRKPELVDPPIALRVLEESTTLAEATLPTNIPATPGNIISAPSSVPTSVLTNDKDPQSQSQVKNPHRGWTHLDGLSSLSSIIGNRISRNSRARWEQSHSQSGDSKGWLESFVGGLFRSSSVSNQQPNGNSQAESASVSALIDENDGREHGFTGNSRNENDRAQPDVARKSIKGSSYIGTQFVDNYGLRPTQLQQSSTASHKSSTGSNGYTNAFGDVVVPTNTRQSDVVSEAPVPSSKKKNESGSVMKLSWKSWRIWIQYAVVLIISTI